jgi:DNA invertase Pin-like site-specific DNA recombinase
MTAPGPPPAARGRKRRRPVPGFGGAPAGPRRAAVYLRRSTDDEHQPFSIGAQETALTSYVTTQPGWTLTAAYTDDASGATTSRPGLRQALRDARAGRFDVLLVYRVDRFSRRLSDLLHLLAELDDAGVAFASATEPFDTSASIGRMLVQLLGVFAEFERETIIDRVTKGMATKAASPAHHPRRGPHRSTGERAGTATSRRDRGPPGLPGRRHRQRHSSRAQGRHRSPRRRSAHHRPRAHPRIPDPQLPPVGLRRHKQRGRTRGSHNA